MIRQHGRAPRPPHFDAWAEQYHDFLRWNHRRNTDPGHPTRDWDEERVEAHMAQTWPAVQQMAVWRRWHDAQPARQGPRLQVRGATINRSIAWLVLYAGVLAVASVNMYRAAGRDDWILLVINGFIIGALLTNGFWRVVGLKWQRVEAQPGAPTNAEQRATHIFDAYREDKP